MLSLFIRKLCTHSQSSYGVYTLQAHVWFKIYKFSRKFIFFMLTLSTHVSGFTIHTIIWFTLSKHMLGSKILNFHRSSFCSYLHSPHMFQGSLSIQIFTRDHLFMLHPPHMFQGSLSIQLFGLHSPSTC